MKIGDPFKFSLHVFSGSQKYSNEDVVKIVERLIDNIILEFGGRIIQIIDIPMETNCAPLLADLFLYLNESHESRQTNALPNNSISPTVI